MHTDGVSGVKRLGGLVDLSFFFAASYSLSIKAILLREPSIFFFIIHIPNYYQLLEWLKTSRSIRL